MATTAAAAEQQQQQPVHKRPRYCYLNNEWEEDYHNNNSKKNDDEEILGLEDLFNSHRRGRRDCNSGDNMCVAPGEKQLGDDSSSSSSSFFTFRLEHRDQQQGTTTAGAGAGAAPHYGGGEERLLLFRTNRPGAVGKIIYSSSISSSRLSNNENENGDCSVVQAKIHVLEVKEPYRGFDLGGLFFDEVMASLRHKYNNIVMDPPRVVVDEGSLDPAGNDVDKNENPTTTTTTTTTAIRCQLDAEEDTRRHNKLVQFYQNLGCAVKPNAKIHYINNNDGEVYRKVPMQKIMLSTTKDSTSSSLVRRELQFLPVSLCEPNGRRILPFSSRSQQQQQQQGQWLIIEAGNGFVEFHTTRGCRTLSAESDGCCDAISDNIIIDDDNSNGAGLNKDDDGLFESRFRFRICRVPTDFDDSDHAYYGEDLCQNEEFRAHNTDLWMFESSHNSYLALDSSNHSLRCSATPALWEVDNDKAFQLRYTHDDTPSRRKHYRRYWYKETVEYVTTMKERYLTFNRKRMSLREALDLARSIPAYHFSLQPRHQREHVVNVPSLRTRCFHTAEMFREAGHPDWIQLTALVYSLGEVMKCIDDETAVEAKNDYDWTILTTSRVLGCAASPSSCYGELRFLNADERDVRYNNTTGDGMYASHCGLENVLLTWNGPEYMYHMLKHNHVELPEDGLKMIRFASLEDWYSRDAYARLVSDDDEDVKPFVEDFATLLKRATDESRHLEEIETCDNLWDNYYKDIAIKYNAHDLMW